jgi:hypothetical protein
MAGKRGKAQAKGKAAKAGHLKKCPACGKRCGAPIFYGMPTAECMADLMQGAKDGMVVIGGCCVTDHDPRWRCTNCGHAWGKFDGGD